MTHVNDPQPIVPPPLPPAAKRKTVLERLNIPRWAIVLMIIAGALYIALGYAVPLIFKSTMDFLEQLTQETPLGSSDSRILDAMNQHGYDCKRTQNSGFNMSLFASWKLIDIERWTYTLTCSKTDHVLGFGSFAPDNIIFKMSKDGMTGFTATSGPSH